MRAKMFFAFWVLFVSCVGASANADDKGQASAYVTDLGKKALAVISDSAKSKEEKNTALEKMFIANVDIDWIGQFVVGRYWKAANEEQKKQYMENYKNFLVSHYTSNFAEFTNANFEVTRVVPDESGGNTVTMRIKRPQAEDLVVDYTVRKNSAGAMKVYDITVEGVSMITTQRSDFSAVIAQNGFDYLISQLKTRSQQEKDPSNKNS
jgi:phospholipid transport system substrate-binding protein